MWIENVILYITKKFLNCDSIEFAISIIWDISSVLRIVGVCLVVRRSDYHGSCSCTIFVIMDCVSTYGIGGGICISNIAINSFALCVCPFWSPTMSIRGSIAILMYNEVRLFDVQVTSYLSTLVSSVLKWLLWE